MWYFNYDNVGESEYNFAWVDDSFLPIAGDWDGDGKAGLFRPSDGRWFFNYDNAGGSEYNFVWGDSIFLPVAGD